MSSKSIFTHFIITTLFSSLPLAHAYSSSSSSHNSRNIRDVHVRRHLQHQRGLDRIEIENGARAVRRQDASASASGAAEYALVGCFSELSAEGTHVLNHAVPWNQISLQTCIESCYDAGGYTFAGIIAGTECVCDNAISSLATQVDQSNCQLTCAQGVEGVNGWCGGPNAYQIYYSPSAANGVTPTSIVPTVAGILDVAQAVDGSVAQYGLVGCFADDVNSRVLNGPTYIDETVTPQACSSYCYAQGYLFSGVEFGNECYCGANILNAINADDCTQACSGDSTKICGAPKRLTIYQLISSNLPTASTTPTDTLTDPFSTDPSSNPPPESTQVGQTGQPSSGPGSTDPSPAPSGWISPSWTPIGCFADDISNRVMIDISSIGNIVADLLDPALMSIQGCTSACANAGFMLAGLEFGSECYCSNSVPPVQTSIYDCDTPCPVGGGTCGGGLRLNVYGMTV